MGRELVTAVVCDGQKAKAKVLLESSEIVWRGELKRKFPFASITKPSIQKGWLSFTCAGEKVSIQLDAADTWLQRICNPPSRIDKLRIKSGMKVALFGAVEEGVAAELQSAGAAVTTDSIVSADALLLFVRTMAELKQLNRLKSRLADSGAIWVMWPKGAGGAVKHEDVAAAGKSAGLSQNISIGFSPTYTGLRFVLPRK